MFILPYEVFDVRHSQGLGLAHPDISLVSGLMRHLLGHHRPDWRRRDGIAFSIWLLGALTAVISVRLGFCGREMVANFFLPVFPEDDLAIHSRAITARALGGA